jgi:hypothetical protein
MLAGRGYTLSDFLEERRQERALEREQDMRDDARIARAVRRRKPKN